MTNLTASLGLPAINLVCTCCTDGDRESLERWYNDHAQLLMASPQLLRAQLFRVEQAEATSPSLPAPDYFCLYHFSELADFAAFDSGLVMDRVRELSNAAAGRQSIEIVKRTQFVRVLHRQFASPSQAASVHAMLFTAPQQSAEALVRWLNDALYAASTRQALSHAQAYLAENAQGLELLLLSNGEQALPADWHLSPSPYAQRPDLLPVWRLAATPISHWLR